MDQQEVRRFIDELRDEASKDYVPVMRKQTAALLAEILREKRPRAVLEIGTCLGVSGLTVLNESEAFLTTVEIDEERWLKAKENFAKCGFSSRVNAILGDCREVLNAIDEEYDFVILDGPKSAYKDNFLQAFKLLPVGGAVFADDVFYHDKVNAEIVEHKHRTIVNGLRNFISLIETDKRLKTTRYDLEDGVAVIERIG